MVWIGGQDEVAFGAGADGADGSLTFGAGKPFLDRFSHLLYKGRGDGRFSVVAGDNNFAVSGGCLGGGYLLGMGTALGSGPTAS